MGYEISHSITNLNLTFGSEKPMLICFTNAYMVGDIDSQKLNSGYLVKFARGAIAWQSK